LALLLLLFIETVEIQEMMGWKKCQIRICTAHMWTGAQWGDTWPCLLHHYDFMGFYFSFSLRDFM